MVVCTSTLHIHVESRESTTPSRAESVCTPLLFMSSDQHEHLVSVTSHYMLMVIPSASSSTCTAHVHAMLLLVVSSPYTSLHTGSMHAPSM